MRAEHDQIESLLDAARQENDDDALKSLIRQLLQLAHGHFRKEESVLFEMAERVLGAAALTEMGDRWAEARNVIIHGGGGCMTTDGP
jgi:hemerythrin-like domain-containing protein